MGVIYKYTKENLEKASENSTSILEVARKASGRKYISGSVHQHIRKMMEKYGIDVSRFGGRSHSKGKIAPNRKSSDEFLIKGRYVRGKILRRCLKEKGVIYECIFCKNNGSWKGKSLKLEVDHIDGDNTNNSIENLRFLCPNCHSQTETYGLKMLM